MLLAATRAGAAFTAPSVLTVATGQSAVVRISPAAMNGVAGPLLGQAATIPVAAAVSPLALAAPAPLLVPLASGGDSLRPHGYRGQDKFDDYVSPFPAGLNERAAAMEQVRKLADEAAQRAGSLAKGFDGSSEKTDAPLPSTRVTGVVRYFNDKLGIGFITMPDGEDAYVHFSGIDAEGVKALRKGAAVEFDLHQTPHGPIAKSVRAAK